MPQRVVAGAHRRHSRRTRIHRVAIARVEFAPPMNARRCEPESRVGTWCDKNIRVVPQRRERDVPRRRGAQTRRARRMRRARRSRSPTPVGSSDRLPALFYTRRGRYDATPRASARVDARRRVERVNHRVFDAVRVVRVVVVGARPSIARVENQVRDFGRMTNVENDAFTDGASRFWARGRRESVDVDSCSAFNDRALRIRRLRVGWRVDSNALGVVLENASRRS